MNKITMNNLDIANELDRAALEVHLVEQKSKVNKVSLKDAYEIQRLSIDHRLNRGEKIVGYKLGFTSKAKMIQMGVHDLIWGRLTSEMQIDPTTPVDLAKWNHARVEPEIAFLVKKEIDKKLDLEDLPNYFESLAPALEVIDSRYENFKFTLEDVVADNCSSAGFVIGKWFPIETKVNNLSLELKFNDVVKQKGNTNAILGNPLNSIIELSRIALESNVKIKKGNVILAGAATAAEFMTKKTHIKGVFEGLGEVSFYTK